MAICSQAFGPAGTPHSRSQGRLEGVFWRPFEPKDVTRHLTAPGRLKHAGKRPAARGGPLGTAAIEVMGELLRLIDDKRGHLEPTR